MRPPRVHRLRRSLGRLLLALAATGLTLGALEVAVRVGGCAPEVHRLARGGVYEPSDDPILGYVLKRSYRDPSADLHWSYPATNAHGFRDRERTLTPAAGVRRVAVLGDSVVAGHGIARLEDTLPAQLERRLPGHEVLNLGIGGYCTRAEVHLLSRVGLAFHPDVVVLVFVENDWDDLNSQQARVQRHRARPAWTEWLFLRSDLFRWASLRLDLFGLRAETVGDVGLRAHMDAVGSDNVRVGLRELAALQRTHGFRLLVAIWPAFTEAGILDRERGGVAVAPGQTLAVERLAAAAGIATVRLSDAFRADLATRPAGRTALGLYSRDGMHPTRDGASVAAGALARLLGGR